MQIAGAVRNYGDKLSKDPRCRLLDTSADERQKPCAKQEAIPQSLGLVAKKARSGLLCTRSGFLHEAEAALAAARVVGKRRQG